jgi:hypothetical protein
MILRQPSLEPGSRYRSCLSIKKRPAKFPVEDFKSFEPQNADQSGNEADGQIQRMKNIKAEQISQKRKIEHQSEKEERPRRDPP